MTASKRRSSHASDLLGPPGCGKGTLSQAWRYKSEPAAITADRQRATFLRAAELRPTGTDCGQNGEAVHSEAASWCPDDLVNDLVADRFRRDDRPDEFVMDGYPRTTRPGGRVRRRSCGKRSCKHHRCAILTFIADG